MTDKQIIIDDVDVSKCAHYDKNADKEAPFLYDCKREHAPYWSCASMPNCLYKKYKRKEQECEELKRQHQGDKGLITLTGKMNYQLLQEYDKLKTENNNIKETFDGLFKVQYKLADNNKKLRQCLTEIKEIAEELKNFYEELGKCEDLTVVRLKQILQKISEVIDESNN